MFYLQSFPHAFYYNTNIKKIFKDLHPKGATKIPEENNIQKRGRKKNWKFWLVRKPHNTHARRLFKCNLHQG